LGTILFCHKYILCSILLKCGFHTYKMLEVFSKQSNLYILLSYTIFCGQTFKNFPFFVVCGECTI